MTQSGHTNKGVTIQSASTASLSPIRQSTLTWNKKSKNPFKLPQDHEWLDARRRYSSELHEQRANERHYPVHSKHTFRTRHCGDALPRIRKLLHTYDNQVKEDLINNLTDVEKAYEIAKKTQEKYSYRSRPIQREFVSDIIANKRELFLAEFVLQTKREELTKLQKKVVIQEQQLTKSEQKLEADAMLFDDFLKQTDKSAVESMLEAERVSAIRLNLVDQAKKLYLRKASLQSELTRFDEKLFNCLEMKKFIWKIFYDEHLDNTQAKRVIEQITQMLKNADDPDATTLVNHSIQDNPADQILPFENPSSILEIITELEDSNLSMIHHFQHSEELVDDLKSANSTKKEALLKQIVELKSHVRHLEHTIISREKRAKELQFVCTMYESGSYEQEAQERVLQDLRQKIEKVYKAVVGRLEIKIDGLMMLTSIENHLEDLIDDLESFPAEKVRLAQKFKDKQRRLKMREEKVQEQKQKQEERAKRAQERAQAMAFRSKGRRLVFRSDPVKKTEDIEKSRQLRAQNRNQDGYDDSEDAEFFTW